MRTTKRAVLRSALSASLSVPLLALGACATTPPQSLEARLAERGYRLGEPVERIQNYRIEGYNSLDDENLILTGGPGERYLVTTSMPCNGLRGSSDVGFTSTTSALTRFDKLIVKDRPPASPDCPIKELRRLVKADKAP